VTTAVALGAAGIIRGVQAGVTFLPVVLVTAAVVLGGVAAYRFYRQDPAHFPDGAWWAGMASVALDDLYRCGYGAGLQVKSRRRLAMVTAGRAVLATRLTLRPEGALFECRLQARLASVRGRVLIPWSAISTIEVGDVPMAVNKGLGGAFTLVLAAGPTIDGEFLGSRPMLLDALARAPMTSR
jgi:hypothetical protein